MMTNLMTILVKKDSISSKINTVYYVVPASVRAIFIQDFATGEISYKVKKQLNRYFNLIPFNPNNAAFIVPITGCTGATDDLKTVCFQN